MGLHFTLSSAVPRNVMGYGGGEGKLFSLWFGVFVVSGNYSTFSLVVAEQYRGETEETVVSEERGWKDRIKF